MTSTYNSYYPDLSSALHSIGTFFTQISSRCVLLWHSIEKAAIFLRDLPTRLVHRLLTVIYTVGEQVRMLLLTGAKIVLATIGTCIGLLALMSAIRIALFLWKQSKRSINATPVDRAFFWGSHQRRSMNARPIDRETFWRSPPHRQNSATANWYWYGSTNNPEAGRSAAGEGGGSRAAQSERHSWFGVPPQQDRETQTQKHRWQPRTTQSDSSSREAKDEQVRKQQNERREAQARRERLRNEEQERRRAEAHRMLARDEIERTYQRWKSSCDAAFGCSTLQIPEPPSWDVHVNGCRSVQGIRACTCNVARLLSTGSGSGEKFGERQRKERNRWHPDRTHFTKRGDEVPVWVEELYKAIQNAEVWKFDDGPVAR
jgi:hypothetical protein